LPDSLRTDYTGNRELRQTGVGYKEVLVPVGYKLRGLSGAAGDVVAFYHSATAGNNAGLRYILTFGGYRFSWMRR
jgi:hypothetical protein